MSDSFFYGVLLVVILVLFSLRVLGQILVVLVHPRWLPPMEQWYSGIIPYPILLALQLLFLAVMTTVAAQLVQGEGAFVSATFDARILLALSIAYFGTMVIRYIIRMRRHPEQRWFGGAIPIVFHCVLATYLFVFAVYHLR